MGVSAAKEKKEEEIRQQQQRQQQSPLNNIKMKISSPESEGAAPPPSFSSSRCDEISNEKNKANTVQYDNTLGNVDNNGENLENEKNNSRQKFVPGNPTFGGPENLDNNEDKKENEKNSVAQNFVQGNTTTTFGNIDNNEEKKEDEKYNPEQYPTNPGNVDNNSGKGNRIEESSINNEITKPQNNVSSQNENNDDKVDKEEQDNEKDDLSMSRSVLLSSLQNIDLNSPADIAKIKESVIIKMKEGYTPIFLRFEEQKPSFYYIKPTSNLKSLLKSHLELIGVTDFGDKYTFYNKGIKLDENTSINKLNLNLLSVIDVVK
jgi:hypothetical protein